MLRTVLCSLLVVAAGAQPQGPPPGRGRFESPDGPRGGARFLGAEAGMPGRVVKNAPYSADILTESVQVLADGNRIRQSTAARTYRDSEGRTRREQSLGALAGLAANSSLPQVVFIHDPVAGASYALNSRDRMATRSAWTNRMRGPGQQMAGGGPGRMAGMGQGGRHARAGESIKTEALGKQTLEGVQAEGTRTTITIPAGELGNEQPIVVVRESWYSPDLKTVVLSKTQDPRFGETSFKLTNITRAEPARSLFEVPAEYKVSEARAER
jgi:hypothetical protein